DLFDATVPDAQLQGYDACFYCLGVSSAGMSEAEYTRLTYDLTLAWARVLARIDPDMAFLYVSGAGTGGKSMWAQVKGRTEAALRGLFRAAYMVRLAMLRPVHGEVSKTRWTRIAYTVFGPIAPLIQALAPSVVISTEELGRAMIRAARERPPTHVLEMKDLHALADRPG
ncbi:MAG TPA: epimerase, partial [Myxococcaceae bacterium]|nr:epimerase [Myxococcaceae bacterium]